MYNKETLRRKIAKEGLETTIRFLLSDDLTWYIKKELEKDHIFINGHLSLAAIYSL